MKILIEALHGLGDMVCMLPMIRAVRENYPKAYIAVVVKIAPCRDLLRLSGIAIDEVIVWNIYADGFIKNIELIQRLRKQSFDYVINTANTPVKKAKIFDVLIASKSRIGIQTRLGKAFDDLGDKVHFVDAHLMAVEGFCDLNTVDRNPHLYPDQESLDYVDNLLKPIVNRKIIGVCIGNGDYSVTNRFLRTGKVFTRGWGIQNMQQLINLLLDSGFGVVLIGGKLEESLLQELDKKLLANANLVCCVNKTTIKQSVALVSKCDLVVGVDTGMQHIASATGAKTLSIFGPTNPKTHGAYGKDARFVECNVLCKYCYGTDKYVGCKDRACLKEISVEDVISKVF